MLRHGASLQEVAALLRHRSIATTEIYAKVDVIALRHDRAAVAGGAVMLGAAVAVVRRGPPRRRLHLPIGSAALASFAAFSRGQSRDVYPCVSGHRMGGARPVAVPACPSARVTSFHSRVTCGPKTVRHEVPPPAFAAEKRSAARCRTSSRRIRFGQLVLAASRARYRTLRRDTYSTLFALLASTGLRLSEAIHLRLDDITPDGLVIRCSKFRKSRLVPLHETARAGLDRYLQRRLAYAPAEPLTSSCRSGGNRSCSMMPKSPFATAARAIGLPDSPRARPTPHSLRHTFAVRALQACPDGRDAITRHMLALSTYLGHAKVADTYWYLEAVPELMTDIADSCERFVMGARL